MTKKTKGKGVADVVREQMGDLRGVGFQADSAFSPDQDFGAFGPRKTTGEIIRDRLIDSCRGADGWYMTLDKDIGGNEWQFKEKITSYDHWTNLTLEINEWVRQKTKIENDRTGMVRNYGSGRYRVMFHNVNGNRDDQPPIVIPVDAQEFMLEVPKFPGGAPGSTDVNELLKTIQQTQAQPQDIVKAQVEAVQKGMEIAAGREDKKEASNNSMMAGMFTMMGSIIAAMVGKPAPASGPDPIDMMNKFMDMAKNMGAFKTETVPQKSMMEMVNELKLMGIKIGENEDPMTVLGKVKNMIGLFKEFTGDGEVHVDRPGIAEKILDKIEPGAITELIKLAAKGNMGGNGNQPQVMQRRNPQAIPRRIAPVSASSPMPVTQSREIHEEARGSINNDDPFSDESHPAAGDDIEIQEPIAVEQEQQISPEENVEMLGYITRFSKELKEAVINDSTDKFPYITQTVAKFRDDADFALKVGQFTAEDIIGYVLMLDKKTYVDPMMKQKLESYVKRYIEYVRSQGSYFAQCPKCNDYAEFEGGKQEFEADQKKICGQEFDGGAVCDGTLKATY
jgi:hypothetical protein